MTVIWTPTALSQLDEIYETTKTSCNILGVMRCSCLIGIDNLDRP